jgi:glutathionylspermidine synthase
VGVSTAIHAAEPLPAGAFATLRRRAIFEAGKWDPQAGDREALAAFPLCLTQEAWTEIAAGAEALAREALEAETELLTRPDVHRRLGLPYAVRRRLAETGRLGPSQGAARVMRFDFHPTTEGWRISEVNSDVPGGFIEASPVARLMAAQYPGWVPVGDPVEALAAAALRCAGPDGHVALVHATAYVDDHQVMACLARALQGRGLRASLVSPAHLRWSEGRAHIATAWVNAPADLVLRFFPAEWLPGAPAACGWQHFFRGARTPLSNPGHALLTQTKRFPLVFEALHRALPTWQQLLPETRDPRQAPWRSDPTWVLKPALGRVGEGIGLQGVTPPDLWRRIAHAARWFPRGWAAQRRFDSVPLSTPSGAVHACVGVFTVDGRVAGAYGRVARRPLVDGESQDAAVLVAETEVTR